MSNTPPLNPENGDENTHTLSNEHAIKRMNEVEVLVEFLLNQSTGTVVQDSLTGRRYYKKHRSWHDYETPAGPRYGSLHLAMMLQAASENMSHRTGGASPLQSTFRLRKIPR